MELSRTQNIATRDASSNEGGMTLLLSALLSLIAAEQIFALPLSFAPGLSVENALVYMIASALVFKIAAQGRFRFELSTLHLCFIVLIVYAAVSMLAAALIMQYPGYRLERAVIGFKARLVDQFVFFVVFFYALHSTRSVVNVLKVLFMLAIGANAIALLDAWGYVQAAGLEERLDGRIQGVMGESNQSAAFIACFLPGLIAIAAMARGMRRILWASGAIVLVGAMLISASRGALVALIVASIWAAVRFRQYISARAVGKVFGVAAVVAVVALPVISARYGDLLIGRFVGDSSYTDPVNVSSGRLEIWSTLIGRMVETPITLLTGFGWDVYAVMPFRLAPHNHYLGLWFNLGLIGVICGALLLWLCMREASVTASVASNERPVLIGFAVGTVAIAVAILFVDLYTPWMWFWAYAGLMMRIAVNTRREAKIIGAQATHVSKPVQPMDRFGWVSATRR